MVTTSGVTSGTAVQVATVAPVVTGGTTSLAANTAAITINGSGFDPIAANNTVVFNGDGGRHRDRGDHDSLTVVFSAAPTAGSLTAVVTTDGVEQRDGGAGRHGHAGRDLPARRTSPSTRSSVVIHGFGFDTTAAHNTVVFNDGAVGDRLRGDTDRADRNVQHQADRHGHV